MNVLLVGIGGAGNRVVDTFLRYTKINNFSVPNSIVINDSESEFYSLNEVSEDGCILIDSQNYDVNTVSQGRTDCMVEAKGDIESAVKKSSSSDIDCCLIIGGLGGELGSQAGEIASWIRELVDFPVYGLGILPTKREGDLSAAYAVAGLSTLKENSDGTIIFDNDTWSASDKRIERQELNKEMVTRIGTVLEASANKNTSPRGFTVDQLKSAFSTAGYTSIGYASEGIQSKKQGLLSRLAEDRSEKDRREQFASLTRKSALGRLTLPAEISHAKYVTLLAVGPEKILSKVHLNAAKTGFEDMVSGEKTRIKDVDVASYSVDADRIAIITVLSGLNEQPRLHELGMMADEAVNIGSGAEREESTDVGSVSGVGVSLTDRLKSMGHSEWRQKHLLSLSPEGFETLVSELYKKIGDSSRVTQASRDGGVDVIVNQKDGTTLAVQVKQYSPENQVGKPTVQKIVGVREEMNADVAVVITSSNFSGPASKLNDESGNGVRLISGQELLDSLNKSALQPSEFGL